MAFFYSFLSMEMIIMGLKLYIKLFYYVEKDGIMIKMWKKVGNMESMESME